jgi:hypothetical protein
VTQAFKAAYRIGGLDTLPEVRPSLGPGRVVVPAAQLAHKLAFDSACTRYFSTSGGYVVLLVYRCTGTAMTETDDGEDLIVLNPDGSIRPSADKQLQDDYVALWPEHRRPDR